MARYRRRTSFNRRKVFTVIAVLASAAAVAKIVRAIYRGETIQGKVKDL